jgi:hypothetical protein
MEKNIISFSGPLSDVLIFARMQQKPPARLRQFQIGPFSEGLDGGIVAPGAAQLAQPHQRPDPYRILLRLVQLLQDVHPLRYDRLGFVGLARGRDQTLADDFLLQDILAIGHHQDHLYDSFFADDGVADVQRSSEERGDGNRDSHFGLDFGTEEFVFDEVLIFSMNFSRAAS